MPLGALAQTVLTFTAIVALGAVLRVTGVLRPQDSRALNGVIIYVGLPAFIFRAVHGADLSVSLLGGVAVAWAVFAVVLGLSWTAVRALKLDRARAGGFLLAASLGNTGYLGYPVTAALFGAAAVPAAIFYDVFGTVFALVLVGLPIAQRFGGGERVTSPVRELVTFPAVIALVLGLVLHPLTIPVPVNDGLDLLARMVAPLIMLSVGVSLRPHAIVHGAPALSVLVVLRLLVAPAVAAGVAFALLGHGQLAQVAILEASVPAMMLTLAVGERFELDTDFIASAIFVTTAASALTIAVVQMVVG